MKKCYLNKRARLSNPDDNSHVVYACDSCGISKNHLSITVERKHKGYLCDYCIKLS